MSVALADAWTGERFLQWAAAQEDGRYEFDGTAPVGMTGGTARHSRIGVNLIAALRPRLRGRGCSVFGQDMGVAAGRSIRYPDASVTCAAQPELDRLVLEPRVVFEVLSPSTEHTDRIVKVRDYAAVPSILRYVLIESRFAGLTVLHRASPDDPWTNLALTGDDALALPEAGIEVPVAELYEDVAFLPPDEV